YWPTHQNECAHARRGVKYSLLDRMGAQTRTCALPESPLSSFATPVAVASIYQHDVLGFILEASHPEPRYEQITCSVAVVDGESPYTAPHLSAFFPGGRGCHILHYDAAMSTVSKPYHIFYSVPSYTTQSHPNIAIANLVNDVPGHLGVSWPGNVVVLKFTDSTCLRYENFGEEDIQNIRMHFALFGRRR
ncbi:hypothetical protein C2E23DRAFT_723467, partial [Lenzites betulinus]